jgi:hypothetical protein
VKVFLVADNSGYEGDYTIAVFSTKKKANAFVSRARKQLYGDTRLSLYESLIVTSLELDKEP